MMAQVKETLLYSTVALVFMGCGFAILFGLLGCDGERQWQRNKAQYVRDHQCVRGAHEEPRKWFSSVANKVVTERGYYPYTCGDVNVFINDGEVQP